MNLILTSHADDLLICVVAYFSSNLNKVQTTQMLHKNESFTVQFILLLKNKLNKDKIFPSTKALLDFCVNFYFNLLRLLLDLIA